MLRERPEPLLWAQPDMLTALAVQDIAAVYRRVQRAGFSQRHIAALTGQSQSEVSEILAGRRVRAYELLVRIADGLGIPRGHLGLAHGDATAGLVKAPPPVQDPWSHRWVVRLPVLVDTYGAALQLAESVVASTAAVLSGQRREPPADALVTRRWHLAARALLGATSQGARGAA